MRRSLILFALALLTSSGQSRLIGSDLFGPSVVWQAATDSAAVPQPSHVETRAERRTTSRARLLAGGALAVLVLLALAVALALVRALKR